MERVVTSKRFNGLLGMQVCAVKDVTDEEILKHCNLDNICGTTNGWCYVVRDDKEKPESNPVECADDCTRLHFLVGC